MRQYSIFRIVPTMAVAITLIFVIAPAVFGKSDTDQLEDQVSANTAAIADNAGAIADNDAAIANEETARIADDNIVQGQVVTERAARIDDDNYLQGLIEQNTAGLNNIRGQECPEGEFVTGIDPSGVFLCAEVDGGAAPPAQPYRYVFVSSWRGNAAFGGLEGADAICTALATIAGLPGTYKAWLSRWNEGGSEDPERRFTHADVPYVLTNMDIVAANWADLTDGHLMRSISLTENGAEVDDGSDWNVRTNTGGDGVIISSGDCDGWTTTTPQFDYFISFGDSNALDDDWTSSHTIYNSCGEVRRIYCFQQ